MKKLNLLTLFLSLFIVVSCEQNENVTNTNPKDAVDCTLSDDPLLRGICLDGTQLVSQNETITYTCKATRNFSEIIWTVKSGNIKILNIENNITEKFIKSVATIKFNANFSGASLNIKAINNRGELAEISNYQIDLDN